MAYNSEREKRMAGCLRSFWKWETEMNAASAQWDGTEGPELSLWDEMKMDNPEIDEIFTKIRLHMAHAYIDCHPSCGLPCCEDAGVSTHE